jgi:transposase-like protein
MESSESPSGSVALDAALLAGGKSSERWRVIVQACRSSGTSVRSFCLRHGISQSKFYYWAKRLGLNRVARPRQRTPARFALIQAVQQQPSPLSLFPSDAGLELRLVSGRAVLVRPGFDRQTLMELVAALETLA